VGSGLIVAAAAIGSEFIGLEWWGAPEAGTGRQRFAVVVHGHVVVGVRRPTPTAGREIEMRGTRLVEPRRYGSDPWYMRVLARGVKSAQLIGVSVPLWYPAAGLIGIGAWVRGRDRRWPASPA
jgi:hypothetical protein